ncbi:NUDIX hydrolase [Nitrosomonas sp. sh817]|jgi:ADP-ribose pyrophosphatase YjhB (NUDIX family)|uniref:NUDIX hydrolase n=1 Tax=unclassified Nitrosomonas TaxID=2609265 RepID=UPI0027DBD403|nr:NUDIX hydrolase [Nitrosomonas sp. sh817]WMJ07269.1 NUDIX hydrolase [Nitrosomonas sp. sh817]
MKYCSNCSASVELTIPEGDSLPRYVCTACNTIHYQNPKIVVGCIPEWEDKVLICKRAIEPRRGWWTLPAGFMENNETLAQAAARETLEEANARVEIGNLFTVYSLPHISQVYFLFRARLLDLDFKPGIESLEVKLVSELEIPWDEMAFRVIHDPLKRYFEERRQGELGFHMGIIDKPRSNS